MLSITLLQGGEVELTKKFAQENGKFKEHDECYRNAGISQKTIWIQRTPPGSIGFPSEELRIVPLRAK